jgi:aryl-alcohol dehydrogenase-like predicted oxidoreductase
MKFNRLGGTGLFVSELCLGTMTFGGRGEVWQQIGKLDQAEADALVRQAHEAGINFIDTADVYSEGEAERMTGQAIRNLALAREEIVLATKVFGPTGNTHNARGASRGHIMDAVKASLKRLGTDYIDLYQVHGFDRITPIEETLRALDDLVRQGHVRYIGVSNWAAWHIMKAIGIAERLHLEKPATVQAYYTIAGRDLEREIVPLLQSESVGLMVWSPLAGGLLSGKYADGQNAGRRASFDFPPVNRARVDAVIDAMRPVAVRHGVSVAQIAIAWLLSRPAVTSVIIGAKRQEQLNDNIAATRVRLEPQELMVLDEASRLPPEYPGWMFDFQGARRVPPTRA